MPVLPFVPAIIGGVASVGSGLLASRQSDAQKTALGAQTNALNSQTDLAKLLTKVGGDQYAATQPGYQKAISYYQSLLDGNRAKQLQAVSPQIQNLNDTYQGARAHIDQTLRGPQRDQAIALLDQQHAAATSNLTNGVQPGAAKTLLDTGANSSGTYLQALSGAAGANASAASGFGQQYAAATNQNNQNNNMWANLGDNFFKTFGPGLLDAIEGKGKTSTASGIAPYWQQFTNPRSTSATNPGGSFASLSFANSFAPPKPSYSQPLFGSGGF